jgi:hypothetical protein
MKIWVGNDAYDEDVIAFVRKLKKKTKDFKLEDGGIVPGGKLYVIQLKSEYSLDTLGFKRSIFLSEEDGLRVIEQLHKAQESAQRTIGVGPTQATS